MTTNPTPCTLRSGIETTHTRTTSLASECDRWKPLGSFVGTEQPGRLLNSCYVPIGLKTVFPSPSPLLPPFSSSPPSPLLPFLPPSLPLSCCVVLNNHKSETTHSLTLPLKHPKGEEAAGSIKLLLSISGTSTLPEELTKCKGRGTNEVNMVKARKQYVSGLNLRSHSMRARLRLINPVRPIGNTLKKPIYPMHVLKYSA